MANEEGHGAGRPPANYERKFAHLIRETREARASGQQFVLIGEPWMLGDTYEEVMESLTRISEAGLGVRIISDPEE